MPLEMRTTCEKCDRPDGTAYICSYECTFCEECAQQMNAVCSNCGGELVRCPRRKADS